MENLLGFYYRDNANLISKCKKITLLICKREKTTPKKPINFIIRIDSEGKRHYISSLYPTSKKYVFRFDYNGQTYAIVLAEKGASILTASIPKEYTF